MSDETEAEKAPSARTVLITGLPSFTPRKLLLHMLKQEPDSRFYVVIPAHLLDRLHERLEAPLPDRVTLLTGDTTAIDLGLSGKEYNQLVKSVTDVYHLASIYWLGIDYQEARRVNVGGTLRVLESAAEMSHLERFNHFSTAFVAGDRSGVMMEHELDVGQKFRNAFEKTRFEAEELIRKWRDSIPITVYRPSIIIGDSETGEIDDNRMDGPYTLIKAMLNAPQELALPMPGKGDKPLNMVPVNWVCNTLYRLSVEPGAAGKTFHLTDPNPLSARRVFELVAQSAGKPEPRGRLPYRVSRALLNLPLIEKMFRTHRQFLDDFNQLTIFNSTNTAVALGDEMPGCPSFPDYVDNIVDFVRES